MFGSWARTSMGERDKKVCTSACHFRQHFSSLPQRLLQSFADLTPWPPQMQAHRRCCSPLATAAFSPSALATALSTTKLISTMYILSPRLSFWIPHFPELRILGHRIRWNKKREDASIFLTSPSTPKISAAQQNFLPVMMAMFHICTAQSIATSYMWPWTNWSITSVTEKLTTFNSLAT